MKKTLPTISSKTINIDTQITLAKVKSTLDYANKLTTDPQKTERLEKQLCKACFNSPPRISGATMTNYNSCLLWFPTTLQ
ncbi:hypothetical protein GW796_09500 [archaeon]|nr:hypothetical protein [archaeon]